MERHHRGGAESDDRQLPVDVDVQARLEALGVFPGVCASSASALEAVRLVEQGGSESFFVTKLGHSSNEI